MSLDERDMTQNAEGWHGSRASLRQAFCIPQFSWLKLYLSACPPLITLRVFKEMLTSKINCGELELVRMMSLAGEFILLYFCCINRSVPHLGTFLFKALVIFSSRERVQWGWSCSPAVQYMHRGGGEKEKN